MQARTRAAREEEVDRGREGGGRGARAGGGAIAAVEIGLAEHRPRDARRPEDADQRAASRSGAPARGRYQPIAGAAARIGVGISVPSRRPRSRPRPRASPTGPVAHPVAGRGERGARVRGMRVPPPAPRAGVRPERVGKLQGASTPAASRTHDVDRTCSMACCCRRAPIGMNAAVAGTIAGAGVARPLPGATSLGCPGASHPWSRAATPRTRPRSPASPPTGRWSRQNSLPGVHHAHRTPGRCRTGAGAGGLVGVPGRTAASAAGRRRWYPGHARSSWITRGGPGVRAGQRPAPSRAAGRRSAPAVGERELHA